MVLETGDVDATKPARDLIRQADSLLYDAEIALAGVTVP